MLRGSLPLCDAKYSISPRGIPMSASSLSVRRHNWAGSFSRLSICEFTPLRVHTRSLFRPAEIQHRWQFDLRHLDLDLAEIDVERLVEQRRYHDRESDHD